MHQTGSRLPHRAATGIGIVDLQGLRLIEVIRLQPVDVLQLAAYSRSAQKASLKAAAVEVRRRGDVLQRLLIEAR